MNPPFRHEPVLVGTVTELLAAGPPGWVVDATVGGGGHAAALLEAAPHLSVLGLDRDGDARAAATERLAPFGPRARVVAARFDQLADACATAGLGLLSGVLFDLGVSSPQLDRPERGFSHRGAGPLDMRMDPSAGHTAADVVNGATEDELTRILRAGGEERFARRVARALVAARPIETTDVLAELVRGAIPAPARRRGGDPANRAFQALRIAVNEELDQLEPALGQAVELLAPGGRLVVLAYHSGEDRIVKRVLTAATESPDRPPTGLPVPGGPAPAPFRRLRGIARLAPAVEVAANRRAASVRLRAIERRLIEPGTSEGSDTP
jgi:16S rRNA (cytosine1402-N4)-methyltransferase